MRPGMRSALWATIIVSLCALAWPTGGDRIPGPAAMVTVDGRPSGFMAPSIRYGWTNALLDMAVQVRAGIGTAPANAETVRWAVSHTLRPAPSVTLPAAVSGRSSDLAVTLAIIDASTPGSLLPPGQTVAATGTVTKRGIVGPIGGVDEKVSSVQHTGATIFLVPDTSPPASDGGLTVIPVFTIDEAIMALCALGATDTLCGN